VEDAGQDEENRVTPHKNESHDLDRGHIAGAAMQEQLCNEIAALYDRYVLHLCIGMCQVKREGVVLQLQVHIRPLLFIFVWHAAG
jgi:hypothetical protein